MAKIVEVSRCPYPNTISVQHTAELENGAVVGLDGLMEGSSEIYKVGNLADKKAFAILVADTLQYEESKNDKDFVLGANVPGRAYIPSRGDVFTLSEDCIQEGSGISEKDEVELKADGDFKLQKVASGQPVGFVRRKRKYNGQSSVEIEFY